MYLSQYKDLWVTLEIFYTIFDGPYLYTGCFIGSVFFSITIHRSYVLGYLRSKQYFDMVVKTSLIALSIMTAFYQNLYECFRELCFIITLFYFVLCPSKALKINFVHYRSFVKVCVKLSSVSMYFWELNPERYSNVNPVATLVKFSGCSIL